MVSVMLCKVCKKNCATYACPYCGMKVYCGEDCYHVDTTDDGHRSTCVTHDEMVGMRFTDGEASSARLATPTEIQQILSKLWGSRLKEILAAIPIKVVAGYSGEIVKWQACDIRDDGIYVPVWIGKPDSETKLESIAASLGGKLKFGLPQIVELMNQEKAKKEESIRQAEIERVELDARRARDAAAVVAQNSAAQRRIKIIETAMRQGTPTSIMKTNGGFNPLGFEEHKMLLTAGELSEAALERPKFHLSELMIETLFITAHPEAMDAELVDKDRMRDRFVQSELKMTEQYRACLRADSKDYEGLFAWDVRCLLPSAARVEIMNPASIRAIMSATPIPVNVKGLALLDRLLISWQGMMKLSAKRYRGGVAKDTYEAEIESDDTKRSETKEKIKRTRVFRINIPVSIVDPSSKEIITICRSAPTSVNGMNKKGDTVVYSVFENIIPILPHKLVYENETCVIRSRVATVHPKYGSKIHINTVIRALDMLGFDAVDALINFALDMERCSVCGLPLKAEVSVHRGIGTVCYKRILNAVEEASKFSTTEESSKEAERDS